MKKCLMLGMTILLTGLAATAMAERGVAYGSQHDRYDRVGRIDHRLESRSDRLGVHFDHKVDRIAGHNRYQDAYRPKHKGEKLKHRLHHKGDRFKPRYDRRAQHSYRHHQHRSGYAAPRHYRYDDRARLGIYLPGFWFSGIWHD